MTINKTEIYGIAVLCGTIAGHFAGRFAGMQYDRFGLIDLDKFSTVAVLCAVSQAVSFVTLAAVMALNMSGPGHQAAGRQPPNNMAGIQTPVMTGRQPPVTGHMDIVLPAAVASIFLCSFFCYLSDSLLQVSSPPWIEKLASGDFAKGKRLSLCKVIDGIGFSDRENNALVKALLSGDRSSLSPATTAAFRDSGAAHILALSGLHFGIVYMVLNRLLKVLGNSLPAERLRALATIAATACYAIITGAGPSVCRAFIFIIFREMSKLGHRDSSLRTILWSSFIFQTALQPSAISSVSFQLSYSAIAGIAYINPLLSETYDAFVSLFQHREGNVRNYDAGNGGNDGHDGYGRNVGNYGKHGKHGNGSTDSTDSTSSKSPMKRLWQSLSVSLSCQITTAPLAWYHFHSFPQYFLIANLFALPAVGLIIPLSAAAVLLTSAGLPSTVIVRADELLLNYIRWVLGTVAGI